MSSTLADLQRLNIKKMEDAESPQDSAINTPSNEASITPSKHQLNEDMNDSAIKASNDAVSEVSSEGAIIPSSTPSQKQDKHQASKPRPKNTLDNASLPNAPLSSGNKAVRIALEAQIREHLIEQLMPQNGKGPVTRLNVEMPEDLHQMLKQHCVQTRTPIKGLINALIAWYLEAEGEA
jgi:hypothetical protein